MKTTLTKGIERAERNVRRKLLGLETNYSRVYLERFLGEAAAALPKDGMVLDAGAGECQYQYLFAHARYESVDFAKFEDAIYGKLTYVSDLAGLPMEDARYDMVVCTQVLEHVPDPLVVLKELHRVLKPGGQLWLTSPFFYPEHHQPYDFYRYTQFGFKHLLGQAGFEVNRMEWLEGYYETLSFQLRTAGHALPVSPRMYGGGVFGSMNAAGAIFLKPFFLVLSRWFTLLESHHKNTTAGMCKNYAIVAHT
jgi:SAM-dependent methyltransferase